MYSVDLQTHGLAPEITLQLECFVLCRYCMHVFHFPFHHSSPLFHSIFQSSNYRDTPVCDTISKGSHLSWEPLHFIDSRYGSLYWQGPLKNLEAPECFSSCFKSKSRRSLGSLPMNTWAEKCLALCNTANPSTNCHAQGRIWRLLAHFACYT